MKNIEIEQVAEGTKDPKTKTSGEKDKRRKENVAKKLDGPSESFSNWLASIVERKRAEIRDSKPLKDDAGCKSKKKQGEEG